MWTRVWLAWLVNIGVSQAQTGIPRINSIIKSPNLTSIRHQKDDITDHSMFIEILENKGRKGAPKYSSIYQVRDPILQLLRPLASRVKAGDALPRCLIYNHTRC